jgi:hypothetical protein
VLRRDGIVALMSGTACGGNNDRARGIDTKTRSPDDKDFCAKLALE